MLSFDFGDSLERPLTALVERFADALPLKLRGVSNVCWTTKVLLFRTCKRGLVRHPSQLFLTTSKENAMGYRCFGITAAFCRIAKVLIFRFCKRSIVLRALKFFPTNSREIARSQSRLSEMHIPWGSNIMGTYFPPAPPANQREGG